MARIGPNQQSSNNPMSLISEFLLDKGAKIENLSKNITCRHINHMYFDQLASVFFQLLALREKIFSFYMSTAICKLDISPVRARKEKD